LASDLGDAVLNLKTDSSQFDSGLKKAEGSAKDFGTSVAKSADDADKKMTAAGQSAGGLGSKLGGVASIAGGFIVAQGITQMGGYLMDAAKGAAADEQATMRLQQTLKNLGGDYDGNLAKVNAAIAAGEKLAFTDDDVRDSFQFLANATGDADEALKRQTVAMDLARGANIPLATATKMVGKVNEENVEAFRKLGIVIGDNATEADALAAVQAKYAGQSSEYASSTAGQFEVAQIRMAEAQETIGGALLPAMTGLATIMSSVLPPAFALLSVAIDGVVSAIGFVVEHFQAFLPLIIAIGAGIATVLVGALIAVIPLIWAKAAAWTAVAIAALAANWPLLLIVAAVALVAAGIVLLIQHWDDVVKKFPQLGVAAEAVKVALQAIADWFKTVFVPIFTTGVSAIIDFFKANWPLIMSIVQPILAALEAYINGILDAIIAIFSGAFQIILGLVDVFMGIFTGDRERVLSGLQQIIQGYWTIISGIFMAAFNTITGVVQAGFDLINAITGGAFYAFTGAIRDGIDTAVGVISGFVANMWSWGSQIADAIMVGAQAFYTMRDWVSDAISGAIGWIDSLIGKIKSIPKPSLGGLGIPGFATGVRNFQGGLALVGEQGPELAMLPRGTSIYSAGETASMIRGGMRTTPTPNGGTGTTVNFYDATVMATDMNDARRAGNDVGWAVMAGLKSRGAA